MMLRAAATSIIIWMQMFILGRLITFDRGSPSILIIWQKANATITSRAVRKMKTDALASRVISLSRVVAELPYIYLWIFGSATLAWNSGSLSRSLPRL